MNKKEFAELVLADKETIAEGNTVIAKSTTEIVRQIHRSITSKDLWIPKEG